MKSFGEIKIKAQKGDFQRVSDIAKCSLSLVRMVLNEERRDYFNIQKIFSEVLEHRERLTLREGGRRIREAARKAKRVAV